MPYTHLDLEGLRVLDAVARHGSITAAAAELGFTQSAISRRVAALEAQAGGPLFERLPRGVRLTPAGTLLRGHAVAVLERLERAAEELAAIHGGTGGRLRVGAFATANAVLVPAALRAFREARPGVEITLIEGLSEALAERLHEGVIDVAVLSDYPTDLEVSERVALTALLADEFLVALPEGHPLASADVVDLRDLRNESWIQAAPPGRPTMLTAICAEAGFVPRVDLRVAEWTGKLGYVAAGLGVTLVPALAARAVRPDLVLRPLSGEFVARRTVYTALPRQHPLPSARELVRLLEAGRDLSVGAGRMGECTTPSPISPDGWPPV